METISQDIVKYSKELRLPIFRRYFKELARESAVQKLDYEEFLLKLMEREYDHRLENRKIGQIRNARFPARMYLTSLDRAELPAGGQEKLPVLERLEFIKSGQNVVLAGNPGTGKTHLAIGLGQQACLQGKKVAYFNLQKLLMKTKMARIEGTIHRMFTKLSKTDLLIIDDFGLTRLEQQQRMDIMEIIEDRHARNSLIITSQLPVASWYDIIGDDTIADAILDRLVHTAYRIELSGDSLRKKR